MANNATTTAATTANFGKWFSAPEHGFCRALAGHRWTRRAGIEVSKGRLSLTLHCDSCETARHDKIDMHTGAVVHTYVYPKDYLLHLEKGAKRPEKSILRLAYVNAVVIRPDHHLEPDIDVVFERNVADQGRIVRNVMVFSDEARLALADRKERHGLI